ncbi:MAG: MATE family efflux transporter, partial [Eubacteriales bacterium]
VFPEVSMNVDLTRGNPNRVLFRFALPLFASVVFQQIYNLADSLVAGRFIGEDALAAVGDSYEITLIYLAFAVGCNIGASVVVAKLFGAGQIKDLKTAVCTTFISCTALCLLLTVLGSIFGERLLLVINTPESILADASLYLNIYTYGLIFLFLYNISTGIFTALGDSKTPFIFLAISSISNIFLDIVFVKWIFKGVAGVAWATFLCQGVSCILAIIFLMRRLATMKCSEKPAIFSFSMLKSLAFIAIPSILQQSFISVGNILIQGLINQFDVAVIAGYSAAVKFNNFAITSFTTLGNAASNFTAQNLGAKKYTRVNKGFFAGLKLVLCIALPFFLIYFFLGEPLVRLFIENPSTLSIATGRQFLLILSPFYLVVSIKLVSDGILRGAGIMRLFMISTFTDLVIRVGLSYLFSDLFGAIGIWFSWPVGWSISFVMSLIFCRRSIRKLIAREDAVPDDEEKDDNMKALTK